MFDSKGTPIIFSSDYKAANLIFSDDGRIFYDNKTKGTTDDLGIKIGVYQFTNRAGLENASGTFYKVTDASGAAVEESANTNLKASKVIKGYIEGSNVQVVDEMVNLISAQRAYEMNSKAIQAADDMLSQANQLKR